MNAPPPPLLAANIVLRYKDVEIPHIISTVSTFMDSTLDLFLNNACRLGSLMLLQRIWDSSEVYMNEDQNIPENFSLCLRKYLRTDRHYRQYQYKLSILEAVKLKNLEMVQWLFERFPECKVYQEAVDEAVKQGSMEILQFFYENNGNLVQHEWGTKPIDWHKTFETSAEFRHYDIMWWMHEHIPMGRQDLRYLLQQPLQWTIVHGDIPVAERLVSLDARWSMVHIARRIGASGRLDVLEWIVATQRDHLCWFVEVVYGAAGNGHLDAVIWAVENHKKFNDIGQRPYPITPTNNQIGSSIYIAAVKGHKDIAQYLYLIAQGTSITYASWQACLTSPENELEWRDYSALQPYFDLSEFKPRDAMKEAVRNGHFDVVQWIYETFCNEEDGKLPFYLGLKADAALKGHVEMVKWLHQVQFQLSVAKKPQHDTSESQITPTDSLQPIANVKFGAVQRLPQTGTEFSTTCAIDSAAKGGHLDVVQWLFKHTSEECTTAAIDGAASNGHLHLVKWFHENTTAGCTERAIDEAARNGHLEVVKWLHVNRTEGSTTNAMDGAAQNGFLEVVKWLHFHRREGSSTCAPRIIEIAAKEGHFRVVQWLQTHRSEGYPSGGLQSAALHKHFEIFLFLHLFSPDYCLESCFTGSNPGINNWILGRHPELRETSDSNIENSSESEYDMDY
ncbi:hypothetical protein PHMEG_00010442 [Phytophthora megakarya]|uniref:Uncharacterized protein n=1 Tax=Phytophthora megakarya TaxID=4795 RepID=A0A225WDP9_9STRA|nr:hypothetical protein PHMEG_00010442 [Phytophthora megakarya]